MYLLKIYFTSFYGTCNSYLLTDTFSRSNLTICGDVNVNYLQESDKKSQLDALLKSHNLFSTVSFLLEPTKIPVQLLITVSLIPLREIPMR
jgi:hypothetical protein